MSKKVVVSFCISTYKRKDMIEELVRHILSSSNQFIEVIVVDNYSKDETVANLKKIYDSRLKVYECETPRAATEAWYDALSKGSGEWLFQLIDRDWIDITKIDLLVASLQELEKRNVAFAVAGERFSNENDIHVCKDELETLKEFALRYSHPTGQIFRKKDWDSIKNKKLYFIDETYGIYPHGYLYAILGNSKKGAYLLFDICDKAHYSQRVARTTSAFYTSGSKNKEWFMPESRYQLLTLAAENIDLIENAFYRKMIMLDRYVKFFYSVTSEWYGNCHNEILKKRYHREDLETNYISLMVNGFDYIALFREFLEERNYEWADEEFYNALCSLDNKLIAWLLAWTNNLRKS